MTDMIVAHEAQALQQQQQQQQQQQFQRSSSGDSPARHRARLSGGGAGGGTPSSGTGAGEEARGAYLSAGMSGALAVPGRSPGFGQPSGGGGGDPQNRSPPTKARLRLINDVYGSDVLAGTASDPAAVAQQAGWRPSHPEGVPTDAKRAAALEQKVRTYE